MDGIVAFIVGTLIGVAIHSYIKKERNRPNVIKLRTLYCLNTELNSCYIFNEKGGIPSLTI